YARTFCIFSSILSALSLASNLFPPFPYTTLFRSIFSGALPMWYAIISQDVPDSLQKRLSVRPAHLQRLQDLKDAGRLLLAGPHPAIDSEDPGNAGFTGSLVVAEFASLADAQNWADADPYVAAGVYQQVLVKPFRKVLP